MPILHNAFSVVPELCAGISMSVVPEGGKFFEYPIEGIRSAEEQSKVLEVLTRKIVGVFAFAVETRGAYPPLAVISITCLLFSVLTLLLMPAEATGESVLACLLAKIIQPRATIATNNKPMAIFFFIVILV